MRAASAAPLEALLGSPGDASPPAPRERAARVVRLALALGAALPAQHAARLVELAAGAGAAACGGAAAAAALATEEAVAALEELEARGGEAEDACTAACRAVYARPLSVTYTSYLVALSRVCRLRQPHFHCGDLVVAEVAVVVVVYVGS